MNSTDKEVVATFAKDMNVAESFPLYDTILICSTFYGQEANVRGWFTTFANFAAQEEHHFFTVRNESLASLPYCNLQSADSMDYAFLAYSMGIRFFGPASNIQGDEIAPNGNTGYITNLDANVGHFFQYDLPRHCSISLKVQQDTRVELNAMLCPPGYGPTGGGAALEITQLTPPAVDQYRQHAQLNMFGTQGVPLGTNRFKFPEPIGIPRSGIIEGVLKLSEYARYILSNVYGPRSIYFQDAGAVTANTLFPARFGITLSLYGKRLVQQRGQYHAL